jgi:N-acetylglucosaminyl-diphospho-decaprenol L-rhamnosyltransferase
MSDLGIVIVTYNSAVEIGSCLDAAVATGADVVVVDNASCDDTVLRATRPGVRLVANKKNLGFAAACNQGFSLLECTHILLLNPDAVILTTLTSLREACDLPGAAGAGGCLLSLDGRPQTGFMVRELPTPASLVLEALLLNRLWSDNPVNRRYRCVGMDYSRRTEVEQPAGAFLMIRKEAWQQLGGFDESFWPLWFEDVDFCRRAQQRGFRFFFEPAAVAKHTGAHSISRLTLEMKKFYWYRSLLRYSAKHFRPAALRAVCLAVIVGSISRALTGMVVERNSKPMAAYGKVVRLASRCFFFGWRGGAIQPGTQSQV